MTDSSIKLVIGDELRRIELFYSSGYLRGNVYVGHAKVSVAYARQRLNESRVDTSTAHPCVWIGDAAFDLSGEEAATVREWLGAVSAPGANSSQAR
jgi:hypothetical protein